MKRQANSFTGQRPIFTGSVAIVPGGFNLDTEKQRFTENMVIPGGVCTIMDEKTRKVSVIKTAKVSAVDTDNQKIVTLHVDEFYAPIFCVGDRVAKDGSISGTYAAAVTIEKIEQTDTTFVIYLSGAISGLKADDILVEVVSGDGGNAAVIGNSNCVTIGDIVVGKFETPVDVTADTMQYALYERRVPPVSASQKDSTGQFLKNNPHVKFTQSY